MVMDLRLGIDIDKVTSEDRARAKHIVYAVIYGIGERVSSIHKLLAMLPFSSLAGKEKLGEILKESPSVAKELTSSFLG